METNNLNPKRTRWTQCLSYSDTLNDDVIDDTDTVNTQIRYQLIINSTQQESIRVGYQPPICQPSMLYNEFERGGGGSCLKMSEGRRIPVQVGGSLYREVAASCIMGNGDMRPPPSTNNFMAGNDWRTREEAARWLLRTSGGLIQLWDMSPITWKILCQQNDLGDLEFVHKLKTIWAVVVVNHLRSHCEQDWN